MRSRLVLLVVAAAALAAPGAGAGTKALPTRVAGTLTVGVDIGTVGLAEGSVRNGVVRSASGFEIDLARALARRLGLKLGLVDVPFSSVFSAGPKPFDVSIAHVTITPERSRAVDFSPPYFVVDKGVLVAPGVSPPTTLTGLRKLRICAQTATTSMRYVRAVLKPARAPHGFPSPIDALRAVTDGFCQAMVADLEILVAAKRDEPDLYGPIAGQVVTDEHYGAVFQKGSKLRTPVSAALGRLASSGRVARLADRWFGDGWDHARVLR